VHGFHNNTSALTVSVSEKRIFCDILTQLDQTFVNLNKISEINCVQYC